MQCQYVWLCLGMVCNGKWNGIVIDVIDMREKSKNVLYKKSENFYFVVIFLFEK